MFIFLDTDDEKIVEQVSVQIEPTYSVEVLKGFIEIENVVDDKDTVKIFYGQNIFGDTSVAETRYQLLAYATEGAVLFSDIPRNESNNPIHAGNLVASISGTVMVHLNHAMSRAEYVKSLPVRYFGITKEDPKNILLIDNKKWIKNLPLVYEILLNSPKDWWYNIAFISTPNVQNLEEVLDDEFYYSTPVALTTAAKSKLTHTGLDFKDASELEKSTRGGLILRELTRRSNETT